MANVGAWDVPAGTQTKIHSHRSDFKVEAGAIEHKNRPESVFIVIASWIKPKLSVTRARINMTEDPEELMEETAQDFYNEIDRAQKRFAACFDSAFFDQGSIIITSSDSDAVATDKRSYFEVEINIDTLNTIDRHNQPCQNPNTGKVEMYSFKDLEPHIVTAVNKILSLEVFDARKALVSFATSKGAV